MYNDKRLHARFCHLMKAIKDGLKTAHQYSLFYTNITPHKKVDA